MGHVSAKATIEQKTVKCPFCNMGEIHVTVISEHMSVHMSHAAGRRAQIPNYHPEQVKVQGKCPNCGKSAKEIKEFLETGKRPMTREERIEMLKKRGLPLVLDSKKQI
jgi:sarcosine oxidase delta subunit